MKQPYSNPVSETSDTDFDWKSLIECNNFELKNNLGNLCNRVVVFVSETSLHPPSATRPSIDLILQLNKKYDSTIPDYTKHTSPFLDEWTAEVNALLTEYNETFTAVKIRGALAIAMRIAALGNKLLQANTLDNKTFAAEPDKIATVIGLAVNLLHLLVAVFRPFMPVVAANIAAQIGCELHTIQIPDVWTGDVVRPGHRAGEAARLFEPIKPEMEQEWRESFGGEEMRKIKEELARKAEKKRLDKLKKKEKKAAKKGEESAAAPAAAAAADDAKTTETVQELAKQVEELRT
jgi:methionyl-tRNA synthetase